MRALYANLIAAVAAATFVFSSPAVAKPMSVRALAGQEIRLATIAYRIAAANVQDCRKREIITGLVLHDLTRYDPRIRPAVSRAFSMNSGYGVLGIVPGSVAAEAGLQVDDEIVAVGGSSVKDPTAENRPKSYHRMEQFQALLQAAFQSDQTELVVRRRGGLLQIPLRAQRGCGGNIALTSSTARNAWADGKHIIVTTGMVDLSRSNDEIAFVIAHEMAHNVLGHSSESKGRRGIFGLSSVKRDEIEADSYAVRLMLNAGYQPAGGISFLQNARRRLWWNISLDHPSFGRRIAIVSAAMQAANRTSAQLASVSLPLTPSAAVSSHGVRPKSDENASLVAAAVRHAPLMRINAASLLEHSAGSFR